MTQAISTRYAGATNTRGARIIATTASGLKLTMPYQYEKNEYDNHHAAASLLAQKLKWTGRMIGGGTKQGYCFVFDHRERNPISKRHKRRGPWPRGKTPPHLKRYLFR